MTLSSRKTIALFALGVAVTDAASAQAPVRIFEQPARASTTHRPASETEAPLLFEERWTRAPQAQPMRQDNLGTPGLKLHLYGDVAGIRKTFHPNEDYSYTGETRTNWLITVSDPRNYWNVSGGGKVMLRTRNSGFRTTHIVIKTNDGRYFVSEEGSPDSSAWIVREYVLTDLNWRLLLMEDKPTNSSNRRQPDPARTPIVALGRAQPDLAIIEEIGFSDLQAGGWIPSTSRVKSWAVYGTRIPR